ncbi:MAG: putative glycoside hydrolase, partial [Gemmatimonadaceae bacterium]
MCKTLWFAAVSAVCGAAFLCPTLGAQATSPAAAVRPASLDDTTIVRALYVNRWASQSPRRMRQLIALADSTEINALVIDMKDEFGLNYASKDPMVERNAGAGGRIPHFAELMDTLKAHGI